MTVPPPRSRRWPGGPGVALRVLLAVALLVPTGLLFTQSWQANDEQLAAVRRERAGVEYLRSLMPVTIALVDAQSAAVAGNPVPREPLAAAVEGTAAVDARYGAELRASKRWADIRAKVEALSTQDRTDSEAALAGYTEATDLLLDLFLKVRTSSGLIRDPAVDSYHLQDAVGEELPEALVTAGRLADLAGIAATRRSAERLRTAGELAVARAAALDPTDDLIDGLQAAVDGTESRTLAGRLLAELDGYQRAVQALDRGATPGPGSGNTIDPAGVAGARLAAQSSGAKLSTIILDDLDRLLAARADGLTIRIRIAIASIVLASLLVVVVAAMSWRNASRRTGPPFAERSDTGRKPDLDPDATTTPGDADERRRRPVDGNRPTGPDPGDRSGTLDRWPDPVPVGPSGAGRPPYPDEQVPASQGRL